MLDFGISKLYDETATTPSLTRTGVAMGTPHYMSPEQLNAPPAADPRFDVYAMGVVLYECLTGRPPYDADGLFELVQQIARGTPTPIRALAPEVPPDLEALVARAMNANRDLRHPNMEALIADLEGVWSRLQSGAPAPSVPLRTMALHQTGEQTGPMGGGAWTGQAGSLAPSGPYGHPPSGAQTGPATAIPPVAQAQRSGGGNGIVLVAVGVLGLLFFGALVLGGAGYFLFLKRTSVQAADPQLGSGGGVQIGSGGGLTGGGATGSTNPRTPNVGVTFTGECHPRFDARLMVTGGSGSLNVMSTNMAGLTGSIIMSLDGVDGTANISTQQRMDQQTAINVMVGQRMWTNMALDASAVITHQIDDPISGSVTVTEYDSNLARADLTFHRVTLQNMEDGSLCVLDGRLQTFGATYGQ